MDVTFEGGPVDGQTHTVDPEPAMHGVIYWPPDADRDIDRTDIPGHEGVVEYIYQGDGKAAYVAGILDAAREEKPGSRWSGSVDDE
jgi:hypothetical protein